jgi:hypothetical protein
MFVRAYPRETQDMAFDAHDRAFALFKGASTRGIYDNMMTVVETVFLGKIASTTAASCRCAHYLIEPVACTPASGWEKGQVERSRPMPTVFVIRQDGRIVAEHARSFGRGATICDPWHYVPVLARKPGALRNGTPFRRWVLPSPLEFVRRKLDGSHNGDRQMAQLLVAVLSDGLPAVEAACAQARTEGVHSADVIVNILARRRDPGPPITILAPEALAARHMPAAACARYDTLWRNDPWNEPRSSTR